jgi:YD repeat-containing protein
MVAVVSGNALGLSLGSMADLGQRGVHGQAAHGRSGEQVYVNATTGNLVVQRSDEYLASRGLDIAMLRTYNSRGLGSDDNGDNWQFGVSKRLDLSGLTKSGGTITRIDGDGAAAVYKGGPKNFVSTEGDGAHDTLKASGKNWEWTDGTTRVTELYDSAGKLLSTKDLDGNVTTYGYAANGLVDLVTDASGGTVKLEYTGKLVTRMLTTWVNEEGTHSQVRTSYQYEEYLPGQFRLSQVTTDLSPQDKAVEDGNTYWTRYEYDGASTRVSVLRQKDGTELAIGYELDAQGNYRVSSIRDGEGRITRYGYSASTGTTVVTDPLGNATRLIHDAKGRLTEVIAPTVGGAAQRTVYGYDNETGDVTSVTDARGKTVRMEYDANGNQHLHVDAENNVTERHFDGASRLLRETRYTGPGRSGTALVTRYVYDAGQHLRFVVSAEGRVTEYEVNKLGERTAQVLYTASSYDLTAVDPSANLSFDSLQSWKTTANRAQAQRTNYTYDALGQLRMAESFATLKDSGAGVPDAERTTVKYVYAAGGQLLHTIDGNGGQTSFAYDGLNRLLASTDANGVRTETVYDDAGNRTTVKLASGLWTTSAYNAAGELVSVTQTHGVAELGTTRYTYDAGGRRVMTQDPSGRRSWHVYDAAGRKVADIDGAGGVIEYRYNGNDQIIRTVRYAKPVGGAALGDGRGLALSSLQLDGSDPENRSSWTVYDNAGRLVQTIDGEGHVVETTYDAASRVVQVTAYATQVALPDGDETGTVTPDSSGDDRVARNFYDNDGNLRGALDGEGYLTVHGYDDAGQRVTTRAHFNVTDASLRAGGTLEELIPEADDAKDLLQTRYYDLKGRLIGTVDAEGYLTEHVHDLGGNLVRKIRYAATVTPGATLLATRPAATDGEWKQEWSYTYTKLNQLQTETVPDGTVTRHIYDAVGNLVETTRAWQSGDPRTATRRYDVQGLLIAELGGEGSARLAAASDDSAREAVWARYATKYEYDKAGRRTATIDPLGHRTLHYYDTAGRLAVDVNAEGEVERRFHDAQGDLWQVRRYDARLASLAVLNGGELSAVEAQVNALADGDKDRVTTFFHDHNGRMEATRDAVGNTTAYEYNAFGELKAQSDPIDSRVLLREFTYDRRGLRVATTSDRHGKYIGEFAKYDPFGRLETTTDGNGHVTERGYDRLGRLVSVQKPSGDPRSTIEYDPFGRVKLETDASLRVTKTDYDTARRTVTVTFSDNTQVVTQHNRHGEKVSVRDAKLNATTYTYDKDGRLTQVEDGAGVLSQSDWDRAGRLETSWDANRVATKYRYDAANRVLTQTIDPTDLNPDGLNIVTTYTYDTALSVQSVKRQVGNREIVTRTEFDRKGQVRKVIADYGNLPENLNLTTKMTYDGQGRTLSVEDPDGRVTTYTFDVLGRRETETIDAHTTRYHYDRASNVVSKADAAGAITRYVYDANDRLVYEIDGTGGLTQTNYDAAGRVTSTKRYVGTLPQSWLGTLAAGEVIEPQQLEGRLPQSSAARGETPSSEDLIQERILDENGRVAFTLDADRGLTKYRYDANGNLIERVAYAIALPLGVDSNYGALKDYQHTRTPRDRVTVNAYDSRNRLVREFARLSETGGTLTVYGYDAAGNLVHRDTFANPVAGVDAELPASSAADRRERMVYDAAGRMTARATAQKPDGSGPHTSYSVERFKYDNSGNLTLHRQHADYLSSGRLQDSVAAWIDLLGESGSDRVESFAYDNANRLTRKIAADGAVCDYAYDGAGNLLGKLEYASIGSPRQDDPANRVTRSVYDDAGRAIFEIDAEGAVTRRFHDGAGRVTKTIRFATRINLPVFDSAGRPAVYDEDDVTAALGAANSLDRVELNVYDNAGRLAYTVDAEGAVKQSAYDAAGHLQKLTRYHPVVQNWSAGTAPNVVTFGDMNDYVKNVLRTQAGFQERIDVFNYNAQGLLESSTDALGFDESYDYDAVGNKLSFTNKSEKTWNYAYDGAGRLLKETSPEVEVSSLSYIPVHRDDVPTPGARRVVLQGSYYDVLTVTSTQRVDTRLDYDALGNLTSRTEAAGVDGQERMTRYEYDAGGRQVKTIFPKVHVDDGTAPRASDLGRKEVEKQLFSTVTYDALGNAVSAVDVGGAGSSKTYDRVGRVLTETDAAGGVTVYGRNAFGDVETLTRKGGTPAEDRTITTTYDRMGRAVEVKQPLARSHDTRAGGADRLLGQVTWTEYDAFGQAVKVKSGGRDASGHTFTTGVTRNYYDGRGMRVGQLAELDNAANTTRGGYLTATEYDAEGNAVEVTEFASLIEGAEADFVDYAAVLAAKQSSGDDRRLLTRYDALNRKIADTRIGRYLGNVLPDGSVAVDELRTSYFYDAVGNLTGTQDAAGALTSTRYDALGRKIAVLAPERADIDGGGRVTPLTEFKLDAYGNVVARTDYAGGAGAPGSVALSTRADAAHYRTLTYTAPDFDADADRRTFFAYDTLGRNTHESDALGVVTQRSYDAYGHLVRSWTPLVNESGVSDEAAFTVNRYDAVGRVTDVITPGTATLDAQGQAVTSGTVVTHVAYNTFGEVVSKAVDGLMVEQADYDAAGRVWRSKGGDGVARIQRYDVDGRVTQEVTNPNRDLMTDPERGYGSDNRVTETRYDWLGNAIERIEPGDAVAAVPSNEEIAFVEVAITQQAGFTTVYDNVTESSDGTPRRVWSGTNAVQVAWPSLAGLGGSDVKVEVDYLSSAYEVPQEFGSPIVLEEAQSGSYSQIFESWQAHQGVTLTWQATAERPGLQTVTAIRLFKKNNDGQWVLLIDKPGTSVWGAWLMAQAPQDPAQAGELWVRDAGGTGEYVSLGAMQRFGDRLLFMYDATQTGAFTIDYQVRFGTAVSDSGRVSIVSKVAVIPQSDRPRIVQADGGARVEWTSPPTGTYQRLRARFQPDGEWFDIFDQRVTPRDVRLDPAASGMALGALPLGRIDYELLYYAGTGDETLNAHAHGTLTIRPEVDFNQPDAAGLIAYPNVLTWDPPPADRLGAYDKIEVRTANFGQEPPVYGEWQDLSANIAAFGARRGVSLEGQPPGALQYRLTFRDPALDGADYTDAFGVVCVMPTPTNASDEPGKLVWASPPTQVALGGQAYAVEQVLTVVNVATGQSTNESQLIQSLPDGRSALAFPADGYAAAYDYTLTWRIAALGISLGTATGHVRFGPAHPQVLTAADGQGQQLSWQVPLDLSGQRMQTQLSIRMHGTEDWIARPFALVTDALAVFDLRDVEPADYDYRVEYFGREAVGQAPVLWSANYGSAAVVPQPRFGAAPDGITLQQGILNHVLSWRAPTGAYPVTTNLVTTARRDGTVTTETIQPAMGGREWVNFAGRAAGDYDYTLTVTRADGTVLGTSTGVLRLVPEPALKAGTGAVLAWTAPRDAWPGSNVHQQLEATPYGQNAWIDVSNLVVYDAATGKYQTDLAGLEPSAWDYRLTWRDGSATGTVLGTATGTIVSLPPAQAGSVDGFNMPASTLSWMAPPGGFRAVVKLAQSTLATPDFGALPEYTGPVSTFINPGVNPVTDPYEATRQGLSLADMPPGLYAYEIEYFETTTGASFGKVQGRIASAPEAQLTNVVRGTNFGGFDFDHDAPALHWARASGEQLFEPLLVLRNAQGVESRPSLYDFTLAGQARTGADLSGLATGSYDYTLTFTSTAGEVLTSTGKFHHLNDARVENGFLSWEAPPAGVNAVLKYREHDPSNLASYSVYQAGPVADRNYGNVSLNLALDGADGSKSIVDTSASPKTPVVAGNARISAAESKFGGESLRLNGASDYVSYESSADFDLPGDFTIEGWIKTEVNGTANQHIIQRKNLTGSPITGDWGIRVLTTGELTFDTTSTNKFTFPGGRLATAGSWHHFAVVRTAGVVRAYLDGVQSTNSLSIATNFTSNRTLEIGRWDVLGSGYKGYLDDIRITKGIGRYTGNFALTTEPNPPGFISLTGNRQGVDLSTLPNPADYDYIVEFQDTAGNKLVSTQGEVRLLPQVAMGDLGDSVLSWETPPAGIAQELRYKLVGETSFRETIAHDQIPILDGTHSGFDLQDMPAGEYEVEVVFKRGAEVWGTTTATVRVISQASFGVGTEESVLSWANPLGGITASLQVWRNGVLTATTPVAAGTGRTGVNFANLGYGAYTYKLTFMRGGEVFGATEGSFQASVPPTLGFDGPNVLLGSLGKYVSWTTPPAGATQTFSYENLDDTAVKGTLTGSQIQNLGNGLSGLDISNMPAGRYSYTLTTTPSGAASVTESGEYTIIPKPSLAGLTSSVDPYFARVALQLSFDGTDGSAAFTDSSASHKTLTVSGNTRISTTQSRYGGSSAYFDGNDDYLALPNSADWFFGVDDFTIEAWINPADLNGYKCIFGPSLNEFGLYLNGSTLEVGHWGIQWLGAAGGIVANKWQHVAVSRSGTTLRLFVDGVQKGQVNNYVYTVAYSAPPYIGSARLVWRENDFDFKGYIDDLRITKGVSRYNANFAPPTAFTSTSDSGVVSWPVGAEGETATAYYNGAPITTSLANGVYSVDASSLEPNNYSFKIVYSDGDGPYAQVDSTLSVTLAGDPAGTVNNKAVFANPLTISKATGSDGNPTTRISFNTGGASTTFRYQDASGWHALGVSVDASGVGTVDIGRVPSGAYAYELVAVNGATYSRSVGTFSLSHAGETFTLPVASIPGIYITPSGQIRWPVPTHAVQDILFGWKPAGQTEWNVQYRPYRVGNEFVVDAWAVGPGTFDAALIYTGVNPVTGNTVWTHAAVGQLVTSVQSSTSTSYGPAYNAYTEFSGNHANPSGRWSYGWKAGHGTAFNLFTSYAPGTTDFWIGSTANGTNFYTPYVGIHDGSMTAHPGPGNEVAVARWTAPSSGTWEVNIDFIRGGTTSRIVNLFGSQFLASSSYFGYLDLIAGQVVDVEIGNNGNYGSDQTWFNATARLVTTSTTTQTTYSLIGLQAPASYTDVVGGTPVAPTLSDNTPLPLPQTKRFSLIGTQARYFYRGADPKWTLSSSTVTGEQATSTSARATHIDYGSSGLITHMAGSVQNLGATVQLTLSHQDASEMVVGGQVSTAIVAGSQRQDASLITGATTFARFGDFSTYGITDATQAGTVPVSVPFTKAYVEASIQSAPVVVPLTVPRVTQAYDRWGQVTEITDARNDGWKTRYSYNAAGQVLSLRKPNDNVTSATTRATYDVHGNTTSVTDANGNTTASTFDNAGNLIGQQNADGGFVYNRFDAFGNKTEAWVETRRQKFANGDDDRHFAITKYQYDLKGQLVTTLRPDADIRITGTTGTGQYTTQEIDGSRVQNWRSFDIAINGRNAQLSVGAGAEFAGAGGATETYAYDSLGRRTRATLSVPGMVTESERTVYDLRGLVLRNENSDETQTRSYGYDALGRKTSQTDAGNRTMTWSYEGASQRVATHSGLDGITVRSSYDHAGQLVAEHTEEDRRINFAGSKAGMHRAYAYTNRGLVARIIDWSNPGTVQTTAYHYDAAGNRTREQTQVEHLGITATLQDNYLTFDAQSRLTHVADTRMSISYSYDAVGNRTRMTAKYVNDSDQERTFDYAFKYDKMNRMTVENGVLGLGGDVQINGTQGKEYAYDLAGRRISTTSWGEKAVHTVQTLQPGDYDPAGGVVQSTVQRHIYTTEAGETTETYGYDAAGRLTHIGRDGVEIQRRYYDGKGRMVRQETPQALAATSLTQGGGYTGGGAEGGDYIPPVSVSGSKGGGAMLGKLGYASQNANLRYLDGTDRLKAQTIYRVGADHQTDLPDGALQANVTHGYYDAVGNLQQTQTESWGNGGHINTTVHDWLAIGDADRQLKTTTFAHTNGDVQQQYDGAGNLVGLKHSYNDGKAAQANPDRRFHNDVAGRVLRMSKLDVAGNLTFGAGNREMFLIARGEQLARSADNSIEETYKDEFGQVTPFDSLADVPRQASGTSSYVVQAGDTLHSVAQAVYGDASLWYTIAEANGLSNAGAYHETNNPGGIRAGQALIVPDPAAVGAGAKNNASTLRPYDPTQAIGDTSPNLPPPPPKKKTSFFAKLIMVIIIVVATIMTAGAMAAAGALGTNALGAATLAGVTTGGGMGATFTAGLSVLSGTAGIGAAVVAGAVGSAVGSIAGQVAGIALDVQDSIDWKSVGLSALGGAIGGGLAGTSALGGAGFGTTVARAAIGNALTQGIGVATGLQKSFDWRGVAASAAGAGAGYAVGSLVGDAVSKTDWTPLTKELITRSASGLVGGLAAAAARGGKIVVQQVAVDAFGNALGSSLAPDTVTRPLGNALGERLASTSHDAPAAQAVDSLGDFIQENLPRWELRQANYDRIVGAFGGPVGPVDSSNVVLVAGGDRLRLSGVSSDADDAAYYAGIIAQAQARDAQKRAASTTFRAGEARATAALIADGAADVHDISPVFSDAEIDAMRQVNLARAQGLAAQTQTALGTSGYETGIHSSDPGSFEYYRQRDGRVVVEVTGVGMPAGQESAAAQIIGGMNERLNALVNDAQDQYVDAGFRGGRWNYALNAAGYVASEFFPRSVGQAAFEAVGGPVVSRAVGAGIAQLNKLPILGSTLPQLGRSVTGLINRTPVSTASHNVLDKSWRFKIDGQAQRTGDNSWHQIRTYREAIKLAKDPQVVSVHLDHGYNRALGLNPKTISPNRRPDVVAIYSDGRVARVEVMSKTDSVAILRSRNAILDAQIRAQGYTPLPPLVITPTRSIRMPGLAE